MDYMWVEDMTTINALFHQRQIMMMFQFHSWKRRHEIEHKKLKQKIAQKGDTKFTSNMPKFLEARSTIYCNVLKKSWILDTCKKLNIEPESKMNKGVTTYLM